MLDVVNFIDGAGIDDAVAGFGDVMSFGIMGAVRNGIDAWKGRELGSIVDDGSAAYIGGEAVGMAVDLVAFGGARALISGGRAVLRAGVAGLKGLRTVFRAPQVIRTMYFAAGTLVLTPTGAMAIEDVEVGDEVWSQDEETGEVSARQVTQTFVTPDQELLEVVLLDEAGGEERLRTTAEHPFWVSGQGWVEAAQLAAGDAVYQLSGGWLRVGSATWMQERATVYNFEVAGTHTYFVGAAGAWVHNSCVGAALKRVAAIRSGLSVGRNRTVATARVNVGSISEEVIGISGRAHRGSAFGGARIAPNTSRAGPGRLDAEVKILDDLAGRLSPSARGTIDLFVDRAACFNCGAAILNFRRSFPNIRLNVVAP